MKNNGPVTQREYPVGEHETLLSATDLKGRITYANDAFIACSGFQRDELYGKAHNLVRHPDMPAAAFDDMWSTVKSGRTWTALVKNRRKDGDHYWVRANAAPIRQQGEVTGYLSVRTRPDRDSVAAHENVYREIRTGSRQLGLLRGQLVRKSLMGLYTRWRFVSLATRMCLGLSVLWLVGAAAMAWSGGGAGIAMACAGGLDAGRAAQRLVVAHGGAWTAATARGASAGGGQRSARRAFVPEPLRRDRHGDARHRSGVAQPGLVGG